MTEPQAQVISSSPPPDWETLEAELLCPMCEYNLRGIAEPRCPECGYKFAWDELIDAQLNQHPYVFEQQNHRRFTAFWRTAIGGLLPGKFWRGLTPGQQSHPRRVWLYFAICMLVGIAGGLLSIGTTQSQGFWVGGSYYYFVSAHIRAQWYCFFATIYWPIATGIALMVFRISMNRIRLRPIHATRCALYSADCVLWLGLMLIMWSGCVPLFHNYYTAIPLDAISVLPEVTLLFLILFIYRLCRAYALYMRFDRPIATVLASQVIVALGWAAIVLNVIYKPWR